MLLIYGLAFLAATTSAPAAAAGALGITVSEGVVTYLAMLCAAVTLAIACLHAGEFVGCRLLARRRIGGFLTRYVGGSRAVTATCILLFAPCWCILTGSVAYHFGHSPIWGIPVVTGAWLATQAAVSLAAAPAVGLVLMVSERLEEF